MFARWTLSGSLAIGAMHRGTLSYSRKERERPLGLMARRRISTPKIMGSSPTRGGTHPAELRTVGKDFATAPLDALSCSHCKVRAREGTVLAKILRRLSSRFNHLEMVERC